MNAQQALDYLYKTTVIEPACTDERAELAINILQASLEALRTINEELMGLLGSVAQVERLAEAMYTIGKEKNDEPI